MKMTPVTSSNIAAIWYDLEKSELYIKFKNSNKFAYLGVTQEEYGRLINAESIGKHFNQFIKAVKVGREVVTSENDTTDIGDAAMSDKEKIKVLREDLKLVRPEIYYNKDGEEIDAGGSFTIYADGDPDNAAMQRIHEALEDTKDGE